MTSQGSKILQILLTLFILFILSCSDEPSSPEEEKPKDVLTIGTKGGIIEKGDFKITIPSGAFDGDYDISVSEVEDDGTFGENTVQQSYELSGLPSNYTLPLLISIKYSNPTQEKHLLTMGQNYLSTDNISYTFLESFDSNGYITSKLPIPDNELGNNKISKFVEEGNIKFVFRVIEGYGAWISGENHFIIYYPSNWNLTKVIEFGNYLEQAYQKIFDLGFRYDARTNWPVKITFKEINGDGLTSNSWFGNNHGYIDFNINLLNDMSLAHVTAGHEFFHLVQFLYDTRSGITKSAYASNFHWLNEASGAWIEEKFSDQQNYAPAVREEFRMSPFVGLQMDPGVDDKGKQKDIIGHGYGLTALIKYLVTRYGENTIINIYEDLKKGLHPIEAINKNDTNEWWDDFLKAYLLGNLYNDVDKDYFVANTSSKFLIQSAADTSIFFIDNYQDLSAKLHLIELKFPEIKSDSKAIFQISGGAEINLSLFKYKETDNTTFEYISSEKNKLILNNLQELTVNGYNLMALVSNNRYEKPYTNKKVITLEIKIDEENLNNLSGFNTCGFGLEFNGHFKRTDKDGISEYDKDLDWNWYIYKANGKFSGNTFTGSFNERSGEFVGSIEVTLNGSQDTIKNFIWTFEYSPSADYTANYYVSGSDIPSELLDIDDYDYRFGIYFSDEVCNHLSKVEYKSTDIESYSNTPITVELTNHSCDKYSNIYISFGRN